MGMMAINQLDVHLKYGGMKPGYDQQLSCAHVTMYVIFNPLYVGQYKDITIGYHNVHFKPLGLSEQVE
ncbi:hypothetical protein PR048_005179 [Dryococelus australis]|uniref:Uncharacterized protein n=1 Tax=Dryococelus australis TaxID=614101 RepID=A0ABQ9I9L3_9NEOP|nr:hypothetical protein PR048_005179 [Dryococelus australis]